MAVETPTHAERRHQRDRFHFVDAAVAGDATHARRQVRAMVEIGVVGKVVDANPAHRPACGSALSNGCKLFAVSLHELMTVHAGLGRGDVRDRGKLDRGVTVPAIETKLADMELVAVGNGLHGTVADVDVPRGKVVPDASGHECRTENARDGGYDRKFVPPGWEDLSQWLGLPGAEGQLPKPRVRDGTVMPHPLPQTNSCKGITENLFDLGGNPIHEQQRGSSAASLRYHVPAPGRCNVDALR